MRLDSTAPESIKHARATGRDRHSDLPHDIFALSQYSTVEEKVEVILEANPRTTLTPLKS